MPDNIARKRLKQKVLERWENEGGKIATEPKGVPGNNPTEDQAKEADRSSRSSKNPISTSVSPKGKGKSR